MEVNEIITAAEAGNITRYLSGCICDECGTSRYDMDIYCAADQGDERLTFADGCCDMTDYFDAEKGYKV